MPHKTKKKQQQKPTDGTDKVKHKHANTKWLLSPLVGTAIVLLVSALLYYTRHISLSNPNHVERITNESQCSVFGSCPASADLEDPGNSTIPVPDECTLVMAPSSIENGGWGVFTLVDKKKDELALERGKRELCNKHHECTIHT
jgi:hypothetical protein